MKIPQLRFSIYDKEWKEWCLKDIVYPAGSKNRDNLPLESYSISNEMGFMPQDEKFENGGTMKNADKSMYYIVSPRSFAYNPARINVGSIGYYEGSKDVIVSSLYVIFKTDENVCDNHYLIKLLKSEKFKKMIELYQEGGVRLYFFWDKLIQCKLQLPSKGEQKAISDFLDSTDKLILSTSKKINSLRQMKAASMQSMFPQKGENKPKVRFKGFENNYSAMKAGNLFKTFDDRNHPDLPVLSACQDIRGMAPRSESGYDIFHDKSNEVTYKRVLPGHFVIHLRSFQGGFAHSAVEGICSPAYTVFSFKEENMHDDYYWKYIFMSKAFIDRLKLITYGIRDGRSISFKEFMEMEFVFPSFEEQKQISTFFRTLDKQIALEEKKLESLRRIKSACLDKMIV